MALMKIRAYGLNRKPLFIDYPNCVECKELLGMDCKEIDGKKFCNSCAENY